MKQCSTTLCDVTSLFVSDLPLKSSECYVLFSEVSMTLLYNVNMVFYNIIWVLSQPLPARR